MSTQAERARLCSSADTRVRAVRGVRFANETTTSIVLLYMSNPIVLQGGFYPRSCERHSGKVPNDRAHAHGMQKEKKNKIHLQRRLRTEDHTRVLVAGANGQDFSVLIGWPWVVVVTDGGGGAWGSYLVTAVVWVARCVPG
jgi:hypothetical protein